MLKGLIDYLPTGKWVLVKTLKGIVDGDVSRYLNGTGVKDKLQYMFGIYSQKHPVPGARNSALYVIYCGPGNQVPEKQGAVWGENIATVTDLLKDGDERAARRHRLLVRTDRKRAAALGADGCLAPRAQTKKTPMKSADDSDSDDEGSIAAGEDMADAAAVVTDAAAVVTTRARRTAKQVAADAEIAAAAAAEEMAAAVARAERAEAQVAERDETIRGLQSVIDARDATIRENARTVTGLEAGMAKARGAIDALERKMGQRIASITRSAADAKDKLVGAAKEEYETLLAAAKKKFDRALDAKNKALSRLRAVPKDVATYGDIGWWAFDKTPDGKTVMKNWYKETARGTIKYLKNRYGEMGYLFEIARLATRTKAAIKLLCQFKLFRDTIQEAMNRDISAASTSAHACETVFMTKSRIMIGQERFARLLHHSTDRFNGKGWTRTTCGGEFDVIKFSLTASRWYLKKGKQSLLKRFADFMPKLTDIYFEGKKVGCMADPMTVIVRCAESALADPRYRPHFLVIVDPGLPKGHVRVLIGYTWDGYPRNKKTGSCEFAVCVLNLGGAAHAPENMWILASGDIGEHSPEMDKVYTAVDVAHAKLKASEPADAKGIELRVAEAPRGVDPIDGKVYGHFSAYPLADLKAQAASLRVASGAATAARSGGLRVQASKNALVEPEWHLVSQALKNWHRFTVHVLRDILEDPPPFEGWVIWTEAWIERMVAGVVAFRKTDANLSKSADALHKAVLDYCDMMNHCFSEGEPPFKFALTGLFCLMHIDTNESSYVLTAVDVRCRRYDEQRNVEYDDKGSLQRKYHQGLAAARLSRISEGLAKNPPASVRLAGDDTITWFQNLDAIFAAAVGDDETPWEKLEREGWYLRAHLHRALARLHSKHTGTLDQLEAMVNIGQMMQRLANHLQHPQTYNFFYLTKAAPLLLKELAPSIMLSSSTLLFPGSLSSCQGGEALHAYSKLAFALLTSQRPGCHHEYMETRLIFQIAGGSGDFDVRFEHTPKSRDRFAEGADDDADDGTCFCCRKMLNDSDGAEPPGSMDERSRAFARRYLRFAEPMCTRCLPLARVAADLCSTRYALGETKDRLEEAAVRARLETRRHELETELEARRVAAERAEAERVRKAAEAAGIDELADSLGEDDEAAAELAQLEKVLDAPALPANLAEFGF